MTRFLCAAVFAVAACGQGQTNNTGNNPLVPGAATGTYAAKCKVSCRAPENGPCAAQETAQCESDCAVLTEGLAMECATCIVENTGWTGRTCQSACGGMIASYFGPGSINSVPICSTGSAPPTCESSEEKCTGFVVPKTSDCSSACKPK